MLEYRDIPREFNVTTHFLDGNVEQGRGDRTALVCDDVGVTYAQLARRANRIGNALLELGVRPEERVLLVLRDGVDFVATWYAVLKIGAVTAEAYTFLQAKDYAYYLDYTRAGVVVVDEAALEAVREAATGSRWLRTLVVAGAAELRAGEVAFDDVLGSDELDAAPTTRDDIAIWKFTTGSTGAPKAAVHPHHSPLLSFHWYARGVLDISPDDRVLAVPKLFFGYARDLVALYPFGVGATGVTFAERSTAQRIFELVARHRPTILVQVPTMIGQMLDADAAAADLSSLRLCTSAGEALPAALHRRWLERFGVEILDGIGSSEAYHIYVSNRPGQARAGSLGQVVPGYRATVVDADGAAVPDGETGQLVVEGDTAALMYWNEHEKSKQVFAGDRVRTGDLALRDEDGFFHYRGRVDDLLKVGGIFVAPAEVEGCLIEHPDVLECAVTGVERDGLVSSRAHVVLTGGRDGTPELARALQDHVRARLSPHKYPREVAFLAELPKTASGKVDRRALAR